MKRMVMILCAACVFLVASGLHASVVRYMPLSALVEVADCIVSGTVIDQWTKLDDTTGRIYTYSEIRVNEALKGKEESRVVVRQLGGSINGLEMRIAGTAMLQKNSEILVFLKKKHDIFMLRGFGQGIFKMISQNGETLAVQQSQGMSLIEDNAKSGKPLIRSADAIEMKVESLKAEIRAHLASLQSQGGGK